MFANRSERRWIAGAAILALAIVVVGWFFLISPQRAETADVQGQTADAQTQNLTLQTRISRLDADSKNRSKYAAALGAARRALPTRSDMSPFIRNVQTIASTTSTRVTTLNVGDPQAVTPAPASVVGTAGTTDAAVPTPAAATGMFTIPIDISVVGQSAALNNFVNKLQSVQPRAVLVTSVGRTGGEAGSSILQLKLSAFVAPATTPAAATPSPGG